MSDYANTSTAISQSGKSGGDATGIASATSGSAAGMTGGVGVSGFGAVAVGMGGGAAGAGTAAIDGGDVSDNTSIGSITINS